MICPKDPHIRSGKGTLSLRKKVLTNKGKSLAMRMNAAKGNSMIKPRNTRGRRPKGLFQSQVAIHRWHQPRIIAHHLTSCNQVATFHNIGQ